MSEPTEPVSSAPKPAEPHRHADPTVRNLGLLVGRYRWVICGLLFFATTINYVDRQVFSLLGPELQKKFHWTDKDYTDIIFWFEVAYAIGLLGAGRLLDRIGTRVGYALSLTFWSFAAIIHALMSTIFGFSVARFLLGFGEGGNFPSAIKTVAEWFPKKERALATGIFNAGSNVGAVIAPLGVPLLYLKYGWQWCFIFTGSLGLLWLLFWLILYRIPEEHPRVSPGELAYIQSDPVEPTTRIPWLALLPHRQTWAYVISKFLTDSIWRWYLYLLPLFFVRTFKLDIKSFGPPLVVIYLLADIGSVAGGWLSSSFIKRGRSVNFGRKAALLVCALCVVPVAFVTQVSNMWSAVMLVGLATAAHQGWSANLFTTASDMFPKQAVGSIVGLGGMAGALGAMLILKITGYVLSHTGSFTVLFIIASSAYLTSLLAIHLLVPKLEPANIRT